MTPPKKLSIIIPTFNEERTIRELIQRIRATAFALDYEIIVVDDKSTDQTFAIERALSRDAGPRMRVLCNRTNKGKGACIRQGLKHAGGDLVVVQDGDLEYHPRELPALVQPYLAGVEDVVIVGSRFLGRPWPRGMGLKSLAANRMLTWLTNALYGVRLTDMESCYKVMPTRLMRRTRLQANRFEAEPELIAKLARCGARFRELPIAYEGRSYQEGKKIRARDFFIALSTLLRYRRWRPEPDQDRRVPPSRSVC